MPKVLFSEISSSSLDLSLALLTISLLAVSKTFCCASKTFLPASLSALSFFAASLFSKATSTLSFRAFFSAISSFTFSFCSLSSSSKASTVVRLISCTPTVPARSPFASVSRACVSLPNISSCSLPAAVTLSAAVAEPCCSASIALRYSFSVLSTAALIFLVPMSNSEAAVCMVSTRLARGLAEAPDPSLVCAAATASNES